jgi:hypothetical protein
LGGGSFVVENAAAEFFRVLSSYCSPIDLAVRSVIRLSTGRGTFYGLLVLSTTLAANAIVWIEDRQPSPSVVFLLCFLANGLLVSSHFLGLIFSAVLVSALVLSKFPARTHLAAIGRVSRFLVVFSGIYQGHSVRRSEFQLDRDAYYPQFTALLLPYPERFFNGALVVFIAACFVFCFRRLPELFLKQRSRPMLLLIAALFLLLPLGFTFSPIFTIHFSWDATLCLYSLGFGCMLACALWLVGRQKAFQGRRGLTVALQVGLLCTVGVLHLICLRQQEVRPSSDL